jgi:hypothetical protein
MINALRKKAANTDLAFKLVRSKMALGMKDLAASKEE